MRLLIRGGKEIRGSLRLKSAANWNWPADSCELNIERNKLRRSTVIVLVVWVEKLCSMLFVIYSHYPSYWSWYTYIITFLLKILQIFNQAELNFNGRYEIIQRKLISICQRII